MQLCILIGTVYLYRALKSKDIAHQAQEGLHLQWRSMKKSACKHSHTSL